MLRLTAETEALRLILAPALNVRRPAPEVTAALTLMSPVEFNITLVLFNEAIESGELIDSVATGASERLWPKPLKLPLNRLADGRSVRVRFERLLPST